MAVTTDDVKKAARLASIAVSDEKLAPLAQELGSIVDWIEQLNDVDIEGIEPMAGVANVATPTRKDAVEDGGIQSDILQNAPNSTHGYFVVPRAVE